MKKVICLCLSYMLCFSCMSIPALAAPRDTKVSLYNEITDETTLFNRAINNSNFAHEF